MKKIFIVTKSGHPPTVDATKGIVEEVCGNNVADCNTYAGAPLYFPSFIIKNYDENSSIVLVEEEKCCVFEGDVLEDAIAELMEHPKVSSYTTLQNFKKAL